MIRAAVTSTLIAAALAASLWGCDESALQPAPDGGVAEFGLTAEQSSRVLAKVGDRVITLGDFARTLDRMDQFDRLRYQSKERRRELLDEIVDVELLAMEARRRGLDKEVEVQDAIRQLLRDALLAQALQGLPAPAEIPADEVRAFYQANADKFNEPERRRVSAIVLGDRKEAEKVLKGAEKATTGSAWGELFFKHSMTAPKDRSPSTPADLAGDLGIVGPPADARGANAQVPEPVRAAVFRIGSVGAIAPDIVEHEGRYYIVRMSGMTAGHKRTLEEADRAIRVAILQQKRRDRQRALEEELKKKFAVEVNQATLASIKIPEVSSKPSAPAKDVKPSDAGP